MAPVSPATNPTPFKLGQALTDGRSTTLLVVNGTHHRLDALAAGVDGLPAQVSDLLADWGRWRPVLAAAAERADGAIGVVAEPERWELPVRPSKLICVGTNYHDHLREMGTPQPPDLPYSFLKPVSTGLVASGTAVALPVGPEMIDWEAELALVLGRRLHRGRGPAVLDAVAAYTPLNDLSARDWIATAPAVGIDWVQMKGWDGFSPVGPLLTPREFVEDPQALPIRCWVNGELRQDSNTSEMVFGVQAILEHLAGIMTLEPGDVIATGTPAGVGYGRRPQQFLHAGDIVTVEVGDLGRLDTPMIASPEGP